MRARSEVALRFISVVPSEMFVFVGDIPVRILVGQSVRGVRRVVRVVAGLRAVGGGTTLVCAPACRAAYPVGVGEDVFGPDEARITAAVRRTRETAGPDRRRGPPVPPP